jgi:type IV pilus assembly protein PilM
LSGGCTLVRNFQRLFTDKIGIEAKIIEPFRNIKIPKRFDSAFMEEIAPIAAVATGLALRRPGDR